MPREAWTIKNEDDVSKVIRALDRRSSHARGPAVGSMALANGQGILERAGVRHVLFRAETVQLLLSLACTDQPRYFEICREIGATAASDLWECLQSLSERYVVIPDRLDHLLAVWTAWDVSGGWGKFVLTRESEDGDCSQTRFRATIERNFLRPDAGSSAKYPPSAIHDFWRGYIHGFLGSTIVHAVEPLYEALSPNEARARASSCPIVVEVVREDAAEADLTTDQFRVLLAPTPLIDLWDHLGIAHRALRVEADQSLCMLHCAQALMLSQSHAETKAIVAEVLEPDSEDDCGIDPDSIEVLRTLTTGRGDAGDKRFVKSAYRAMKSLAAALHHRAGGVVA